MFRRLHHPLWTHLPAVGILAYMLFVMARSWPWPESTPVHYGVGGHANRIGSPWELAIALFLLPLIFVIGSVLIDEHWARREREKRFNWLSLLDEAIVAHMATIVAFSFNEALPLGPAARFRYPWLLFLILGGVALASATILEAIRPWRPTEDALLPADSTVRPDSELIQRMKDGQRWVYFESQNPAWMSALIPVASGALLIGAYSLWWQAPILSAVMALAGLAFWLLFGGLCVLVSSEGLCVRLGLFGIRLLRLRPSDMSDVVVHQFSALADFGGWGIRRGGGMNAFFFRGESGVRITTSAGRKYLVGSDTPERLAAILQAVKAAA